MIKRIKTELKHDGGNEGDGSSNNNNDEDNNAR